MSSCRAANGNVIPSAGTSGMRVIAALVKLVRHVAARGNER